MLPERLTKKKRGRHTPSSQRRARLPRVASLSVNKRIVRWSDSVDTFRNEVKLAACVADAALDAQPRSGEIRRRAIETNRDRRGVGPAARDRVAHDRADVSFARQCAGESQAFAGEEIGQRRLGRVIDGRRRADEDSGEQQGRRGSRGRGLPAPMIEGADERGDGAAPERDRKRRMHEPGAAAPRYETERDAEQRISESVLIRRKSRSV